MQQLLIGHTEVEDGEGILRPQFLLVGTAVALSEVGADDFLEGRLDILKWKLVSENLNLCH